MSSLKFIRADHLISDAEKNDYEIPLDPATVITELLDCVIAYGPDYMHGNEKSIYVEAAKKCLMELKKNG